MLLQSYTGQSKLADRCDVAIFQPDCYSWRSKIYPLYERKQYEIKLNTSGLNRKLVQYDGLEQIDLLWMYLIKYKDKIDFVSNDNEQNLFFDFYSSNKINKESIVKIINSILVGCETRRIPYLSKPIHIDNLKALSGDIERDLKYISKLTDIPMVKLKLNYALKYPIRSDMELFVKDFYKIYIHL